MPNIKKISALVKTETFSQLCKYAVVGVANTLITAVVIWLLLKLAGTANATANFWGFAAGVANSFIWNRKWTFISGGSFRRDLTVFLIGFAICYLIQLGVVEFLIMQDFKYDPYYNHLAGICIYSALNFLFNKHVAFRPASEQAQKE